jgi:putative ABC transport system ATP-binding protein
VTAVLELRDVTKVYGSGPTEVRALDGVDLVVRAGEMVAVMGPSGSGKSTLLTIAGSLEEPTRGAVLVEGTPLAGMSAGDRARMRRRHVGYVFQDYNLLPGLTAGENISLPLELDGVRSRRAAAAARRVLEELGLGDRAGSYPDELSGGQRQRVAIARALVGERRLLLADEPSGALDTTAGEGVMRLLRNGCKRGAAAVLATHDAKLAAWADRVVFVRDGVAVDHSAPAPGPESLLGAAGESPR